MVSFSNSSKILGDIDHVSHAYQSTRDNILRDLSKIEVDTGTNYSAGFEQAMDTLGTISDVYTECEQIILILLTDGAEEGENDAQKIIDNIKKDVRADLPGKKVRIVPFIFGKREEIKSLDEIHLLTCKFEGVPILIENEMEES